MNKSIFIIFYHLTFVCKNIEGWRSHSSDLLKVAQLGSGSYSYSLVSRGFVHCWSSTKPSQMKWISISRANRWHSWNSNSDWPDSKACFSHDTYHTALLTNLKNKQHQQKDKIFQILSPFLIYLFVKYLYSGDKDS